MHPNSHSCLPLSFYWLRGKLGPLRYFDSTLESQFLSEWLWRPLLLPCTTSSCSGPFRTSAIISLVMDPPLSVVRGLQFGTWLNSFPRVLLFGSLLLLLFSRLSQRVIPWMVLSNTCFRRFTVLVWIPFLLARLLNGSSELDVHLVLTLLQVTVLHKRRCLRLSCFFFGDVLALRKSYSIWKVLQSSSKEAKSSVTISSLRISFPNDDEILVTDDMLDVDDIATGTSMDFSFSGSNTINQECPGQFASDDIGCRSFTVDGQFSSEFSVPYDDLAELEWLSNFVEESFSKSKWAITSPIFRHEISVPSKSRSKRSRASPCNWESRLVVVSPSTNTTSTATTPTMSSSSESDVVSNFSKKKVKTTPKKKESNPNTIFTMTNNGEGRKCLHCATDKTPQWRTGPMGPNTLCNACGVRYKSGRLVPEYGPQ
ncbi:hypothetical protein RND71_020670 [Anisodus tanguticus]|uniref:GATA-type domain-containing protein n=1 Tax=Anisodus tanguticus TaxID=243964 RepID=A0AAE1RV35_9SOLA|nr:hypothetical protein RND71_020670 [Anisodus tanguticus]